MPPIHPESDLLPPETERAPLWRRAGKRYAPLLLVLLIHLALLTSVLVSRPKPNMPKPDAHSTDVVFYMPKVPEPKPAETPPVLADLPPPKVPEPIAPPMPVLDFKPDSIQAPVAPPVPKPPAVEAAASAPPPVPPEASKVASAPPANAAPPKLFEECGDAPDRNMVADVYRLRKDARSVNDMRWRKPIQRLCLAQLDITPRPFEEGFPGMGKTVEWFGLDIRFTVNVAQAGTWELMLLADDGAVLSIDGEDVIDNDGIHAAAPEMVTVKLEKGARNFRVRFFQGPGPGIALMLGWKKPGASDFVYLPRNIIGRPAAATLAALESK